MESRDTTAPAAPVLVALEPPRPPTDIVQSALFIALSSISDEHRGRKIRTIGQIISFDAKRGILLLAAVSDRAVGPIATLLVDINTPLLGMTPVIPDPASSDDMIYTRESSGCNSLPTSGTKRREEVLKLHKGGFVAVVGWMEGDGDKLASRVRLEHPYRPPMAVVLEAIHISNGGSPPVGAIYRGSLVG